MCGIFAVAQRSGPIDEAALRAAVMSMSHRGPDAHGIALRAARLVDSTVHIGLGHRRLAIIDLDRRSDQPFERNGAATVFNGEIFNFGELKRNYGNRTDFVTSGDTELLAEVVRLDGPEASSQFSGQWSFVQHRDGEARIVLGRDTFGKKPFFIFHDTNTFIASSTIRAIFTYLSRPPRFNRRFLSDYFFHTLASCGERGTPFENISQLAPGHAGTFDLGKWTLEEVRVFNREEEHYSNAAPAALADRIESAVLRRLISDRPIGLLLSGGVDSTLILSVLKTAKRLSEVTCFVGDAGDSDDARYAMEAISDIGATATLVPIDYKRNAFEQFMRTCAHQERPFRLQGNMLGIPQLYRAIAETDIKVVLDGTGADEVFGGYWDRYFPFAIRGAVRRGEFLWLAGMIAANRTEARRMFYALRVAAKGRADYVCPEIRELHRRAPFFLASPGASSDPLARINLSFDEALKKDIFEGRLQDWLWQNDRNAMMYGIEARSPFMDRDLYRQLFSGYRAKFVGPYNKYELRSVFAKFQPLRTQWRRQKQGFRWSASNFIKENQKAVTDICAASKVLADVFPSLVDRLLRHQPLSIETMEKLLSIAGVEAALGAG